MHQMDRNPLCSHNRKWIGKKVTLLPWEKHYLFNLFAVSPEDGLRKYRWTLLGIPKKNGKTELAAWLSLYFLIGDDEPSPWVCAAASSEKQADLVFGAATRCAQWSPTLSQITELYGSTITVPSIPGAKLVRLAAAAGTNDGPSWHVVVIDEFHEWTGRKGRDVHTVLTNGIGARDQPMIVQITTAGFDLEGTTCGQHYVYGERLASGEIDVTEEPHNEYLYWWYEGPSHDQDGSLLDYRDERVWRAANPSWDVTLPNTRRYLLGQLHNKREGEFRRYFLNQWTTAEECWLKDGDWQKCRNTTIIFDSSFPIYVGIDGGLKRDTFAVVAAQKQPNGVIVKSRIWQNPFPRGHPQFQTWKLNLDEPRNFLLKLYEMYPEAAYEDEFEIIPGPQFGYDPHFIEYMMQTLRGEGLNTVDFPQTDSRMVPAAAITYDHIINTILQHDGDPAFERQIHGASVREKVRGWRLEKASPSKVIDAAIALNMAMYLMHQADVREEEGAPSIW